ncbi:MAG: FAD-binding oxidoreductase [Leptospiraceae bacterium]|nr:FAD-binding oxidoreductase [Leptospiraceae bacterium]
MLYDELNPNIDYSRSNLRWDGWGAYTEDFLLRKHIPEILEYLAKLWNQPLFPKTEGKKWEDLPIKKSRLSQKEISELEKICGKDFVKLDNYERIFHSAGKSYYDVVRVRYGLLKDYVDVVCYPQTEEQISAILKFCSSKKIAVIPFGGGSSVVGGVEALKEKEQKAILSLDLTKMNSLLELDIQSRIATFQAGIYGPKLEKLLNDKGYTLGHFPQSFEYSTLGGWVAARSSGQQSSKYGRIDKILVSLKGISPTGELVTHKLPPSAIGPDLNQILAGSEGLLSVITQVTVKVHPLPQARHYFAFLFPNFERGMEFIREANLKGLKLSMMRLSDEDETELFETLSKLGKEDNWKNNLKQKLIQKVLNWNGIGEKRALMMTGVDGSYVEIDEIVPKAKYLAEKYGGFFAGTRPGQNWLKSRFNMPFLRNHFLENGVGVDTLETSITYDRILKLHEHVKVKIKEAMNPCSVMCHISHSYHEGASLYFTILFPLDVENSIEQWWKMKRAATDAILEIGGSVSHHHGIGTDHKEWYLRTLSASAKQGFLALKEKWDPKFILNPKKLFHE